MELKKFDYKFTEVETNVILNALSNMPFKDVHLLMQSIITQYNNQQVIPDAD